MVYAQPRICSRKWDAQNSLGFWKPNGLSNLGQTNRPSDSQQKYLELARQLKKLWNMKVMVIPIIIGVLDTVTKQLPQKLENLQIGGWVEIIQTTAWLRSARILKRVLETCCHSVLWKTLKRKIIKIKENLFFSILIHKDLIGLFL